MDTENYMKRYVNVLKRFINQEELEIQLDKPMLDMGINSFDVIEVMISIEEEFKVEFPDSLISPELFISAKTLYDGLMTLIKESDDDK